jgi:peptidoglycan-N-acetylglucosamine deacetylase
VDRRTFLTRVALGVLAVGLGTGAVIGGDQFALQAAANAKKPRAPRALFAERGHPHTTGAPEALPIYFGAPVLAKVKFPGATLYKLPGDGNLVALTVDDGTDTNVVAAYIEFAKRTGMRLTFFVTSKYPSWTDHAAAMQPLIESGQIQIGNHTVSHPDLTKLSSGAIADELGRCGDFIHSTFGVDAAPYFRPPYGYVNAHVTSAAQAAGYPQPVMWYGTLGDSGPISDENLVNLANTWMLPQHIVIGHANYPTIINHMDELAHLIKDRALQPVTLDDVFTR